MACTSRRCFRLVGTTQISGFNSPQVHVSIVSRFLADLPTLAVSYLILGFGTWPPSASWSASRPGDRPRPGRRRARVTVLVALWAVSAAAYLVYATLLGTIEEQMYYILLLPCGHQPVPVVGGQPWAPVPPVAEHRARPACVALLFDSVVMGRSPRTPG